jgi:hypothetical protein
MRLLQKFILSSKHTSVMLLDLLTYGAKIREILLNHPTGTENGLKVNATAE